jgi:hypothetical protein
LAIGRFVVAERFIMKTKAQTPNRSGSTAALQTIPLEHLKHVAGGVASPAATALTLPSGPMTNPEVSPML